jgi:hypothetical protein
VTRLVNKVDLPPLNPFPDQPLNTVMTQSFLSSGSAAPIWESQTLSISSLMNSGLQGLTTDLTDYRKHHPLSQIVQNPVPEWNVALNMVRFLHEALQTTNETRLLYCGTRPQLIEWVASYFPLLQVFICGDHTISNWEKYQGYLLIYDYQISYHDILKDNLAQRGLTLKDNEAMFQTAYSQALDQTMAEHQTALGHFLRQQEYIYHTLKPTMALWRFTLPWNQRDTLALDGELWAPIWASKNTSYCWLVTGKKDRILRAYSGQVYRLALEYFNTVLRIPFYHGPHQGDGQAPPYSGLSNNWDSWATTKIIGLLPEERRLEFWRALQSPDPTALGGDLGDPFV